MSNLYTTKQAADLLALHEGHIRRLAIALDIGTKYGDRQRLFTEDDIERLRQRNTTSGRPRNKNAPHAKDCCCDECWPHQMAALEDIRRMQGRPRKEQEQGE